MKATTDEKAIVVLRPVETTVPYLRLDLEVDEVERLLVVAKQALHSAWITAEQAGTTSELYVKLMAAKDVFVKSKAAS